MSRFGINAESRLLTRAEISKLARTLKLHPSTLTFLESVDLDDLYQLRTHIPTAFSTRTAADSAAGPDLCRSSRPRCSSSSPRTCSVP
jgi:hypothetical protein